MAKRDTSLTAVLKGVDELVLVNMTGMQLSLLTLSSFSVLQEERSVPTPGKGGQLAVQ